MEQEQNAHVLALDRERLTRTDYPSREDWLIARRTVITSTDVGAILGVDRFSSALAVYAEKLRAPDDTEDKATERMLVGRAMQDGIAEAYCMLRRHRDEDPNKTVLHIESIPGTVLFFGRNPLHAASMDAWQFDTYEGEAMRVPLEIKSWHAKIEEPLESWLTQVQWQMHVTGTHRATIACAQGFGEILWWDIDRDEEIIDALVKDAEAFWEKHVTPGIPPTGDGSDASKAAMQKLYGTVNPALEVELSMEHLDAALAYQSYAEQEKLIAQQKAQCAQFIQQTMGEAPVAYLPNGQRVTWKVVARKGHWVKPSESRQFRIWPAKGGK